MIGPLRAGRGQSPALHAWRIGRWALLAAIALATALAGGSDMPRFGKPPGAGKALRAKRDGLTVALWYDPDKWTIEPRRSRFALLARVSGQESPVTGAFVDREGARSPDEVRRRARREVETATTVASMGRQSCS